MNLLRVAAAAAAPVMLAACGGGSDAPTQLSANQPGNRDFAGSFVNVKLAPKDSPAVTGLAEMVIGHGKTRVTVTASGLNNMSTYTANVGSDACSAADPGGTPFKLNPAGPAAAPNEIVLTVKFELDRQGNKQNGVLSDTTVDGEAGPAAKSVLIYLTRRAGAPGAEPAPIKLACADLRPQ